MVGEQQGYQYQGPVLSDLSLSYEKQNMQERKERRNAGLGKSQMSRCGLLASAQPQPWEGIVAPISSMESLTLWGLTLTGFIFFHGKSF